MSERHRHRSGPLAGARAQPAGHRGAIVWFTGLPSAGKTTLARRVLAHFSASGRSSVLLDSDELREILEVHAYTPAERDRFYRALAGLARLLAHQGIVVLVAATAPKREERARARSGFEGRFIEVWVETPLAECEARDPKGLYAQARGDADNQLPGLGAAYEPPLAPEVIADGGFDDTAVAAIECCLNISDELAETQAPH